MNYQQIASRVLEANNGIAKRSDFAAAGIPNGRIYKMQADGFLQRISQGYYAMSEKSDFTDEQIIASTVPNAVISMESALFHYGYSDFIPRIWTVTLPRSASRNINCCVPLKIYYVKDEIYDIGKIQIKDDDVSFTIYDRERTICDMFKHREKTDTELFAKAINAYVNDAQKDLRKLSEYAKRLRVYNKVTELMEVLLNG